MKTETIKSKVFFAETTDNLVNMAETALSNIWFGFESVEQAGDASDGFNKYRVTLEKILPEPKWWEYDRAYKRWTESSTGAVYFSQHYATIFATEQNRDDILANFIETVEAFGDI